MLNTGRLQALVRAGHRSTLGATYEFRHQRGERERVSESENLGMIGQIRNHLVYYLVPPGPRLHVVRIPPIMPCLTINNHLRPERPFERGERTWISLRALWTSGVRIDSRRALGLHHRVHGKALRWAAGHKEAGWTPEMAAIAPGQGK